MMCLGQDYHVITGNEKPELPHELHQHLYSVLWSRFVLVALGLCSGFHIDVSVIQFIMIRNSNQVQTITQCHRDPETVLPSTTTMALTATIVNKVQVVAQ